MRTFDLTPLFRSSVGFDRMARLLDAAGGFDEGTTYPPYNIEKTGEDAYRITMAVAGFTASDLDITVKENSIVISGRLPKPEEGRTFLYRGIAGRAFERRFELAEHIRVAGASLENGLLHVELVREVPEAARPRSIKIESATQKQPRIESGQAAA